MYPFPYMYALLHDLQMQRENTTDIRIPRYTALVLRVRKCLARRSLSSIALNV